MKLLDGVTASAIVSDCGTYRYSLVRQWGDRAGFVVWIMLNPSTADADQDDRTLRRCQAFTRAWGYDGLLVVNLFALRATKPRELRTHPDPIGPKNDWHLNLAIEHVYAELAIAAWGTDGGRRQRDARAINTARGSGRTLHALELTKNDKPKHPLYVKGDVEPVVYR